MDVMTDRFKQVTAHSLWCPVCLNIFREPKFLSCSHTFCKQCLIPLLSIHGEPTELLCPVCRQKTSVPSGDVGQLQTNLALSSLVDDVKNQEQTCTNCEEDPKHKALVYCRDCDTLFCESCRNIHSQLKALHGHELFPVAEVKPGKELVGRQRKRKLSLSDDEDSYFCFDCKRYVSLRSGILDHERLGHVVADALTHEENERRKIKDLVSQVTKKIQPISESVSKIGELQNRLEDRVEQIETSIEGTFRDVVQELNEARDALKERLKTMVRKTEDGLAMRKETVRKEIAKLLSLQELVGNGLRVHLEADALNAHDAVCGELSRLLQRDTSDLTALRSDVETIEKTAFKRNREVCASDIGFFEETDWPCTTVTLSKEDSMSTVVAIPDGTLGVGCVSDGIDIYDADGRLVKTVLRDENIRDFGFFSDGRAVVLECSNKLFLYTPEWEKLDIEFETNPKGTCGFASLGVNTSSDSAFVSYRNSKHIDLFFCPEDNEKVTLKACRKIECEEFIPTQLLARTECEVSSSFVIQDKGGIVKAVDPEGKVKQEITKEGLHGFPAICGDGSVMIAWVNHDEGLVNIDKHTRSLGYIETIIRNHRFGKPKRKWYHLNEFVSGKIAFCTPDKLYIFRKVSRPLRL